jgi:nitroimidazol reductase NimA-like FMN-containing flavoprotein (pyridoxamine 5'-phosphate oxidase superfamily)
MQDMTADEIEAMLSEAMIGRLSMADRDGRPYTIPLPFCWADGALYLRVPLSGRKGMVLAQNDQVCFEVDRFTQSLDEYASVLIEGRLIPVPSIAEKERVKQINDEKYLRLRRGHRPGHGRASDIAGLPMRKISVDQISGRKKGLDAADIAILSPHTGDSSTALRSANARAAVECGEELYPTLYPVR